MRSGVFTVLVVLAALGPWPANAADTPPASQQTANPDKPQDAGDEVICRRITLTGTLLPGKKICKTRREWEQQRQTAKDLLDNATSKGTQTGVPGG